MIEQEQHLEGMSKRDMLERETPETLIGLRDTMLSQLSDLERDIHLITDVLGGYGDDTGLYDAKDDTPHTKEYPQDNQWITPGYN